MTLAWTGGTDTLRHSALAGCNGDAAPFFGEPLAYPSVADPSLSQRLRVPEASHVVVTH